MPGISLFGPILTATLDRLNAAGLGVTFEKSRVMPTRDDVLPYGGVFVRQSRSRSFGKAGEPSFARAVSIGIVYRVSGSSGADIETQLDAGATAIIEALFHDAAWVNDFEDIPDYSITFSEIQGSEKLVAEAQIAISVADSEIYEPTVTDDLAIVAARDPGQGEYGVNIGDPTGPIDEEFQIDVPTT